MNQSRKLPHLSMNYLFFGTATVILLAFISNISCTKQNNFHAVQHRTKEADSKVNELQCFSCDMMLDGDDCLNITRTQAKANLTRRCAPEENKCSVKRFSYTMSDKNSTSEKRLWSLQRNCTKTCTNSCIIMGERVKIHACETCCDGNLCNVGSDSDQMRTHAIANLATSIFVLTTTYCLFS